MEPKAGIPAARLEPTPYPKGSTPQALSVAHGPSSLPVQGEGALSTARLLDEFVVPAQIAAVSGVRERMADAARSIGFSDEAVEGIRLAVGEAFVNAVKHGSRPPDYAGEDDPGAPIDVRVFQDGDTLVIEIQDQGSGFQPDDVVLTQPGELKSCGRGLIFMRMFMDEVTFEFGKGGTLVRLKKHKPTQAHGTADAGS